MTMAMIGAAGVTAAVGVGGSMLASSMAGSPPAHPGATASARDLRRYREEMEAYRQQSAAYGAAQEEASLGYQSAQGRAASGYQSAQAQAIAQFREAMQRQADYTRQSAAGLAGTDRANTEAAINNYRGAMDASISGYRNTTDAAMGEFRQGANNATEHFELGADANNREYDERMQSAIESYTDDGSAAVSGYRQDSDAALGRYGDASNAAIGEYLNRVAPDVARYDQRTQQLLSTMFDSIAGFQAPQVDWIGAAAQAIDFNEANLSRFTNMARTLSSENTNTLLSQIETANPGFAARAAQAAANNDAMLRGEVPLDVQRTLARTGAFQSVQGGFGGSEQARNMTARDLGLSSLDMMNQGSQSSQQWAALMNDIAVRPGFVNGQSILQNNGINSGQAIDSAFAQGNMDLQAEMQRLGSMIQGTQMGIGTEGTLLNTNMGVSGNILGNRMNTAGTMLQGGLNTANNVLGNNMTMYTNALGNRVSTAGTLLGSQMGADNTVLGSRFNTLGPLMQNQMGAAGNIMNAQGNAASSILGNVQNLEARLHGSGLQAIGMENQLVSSGAAGALDATGAMNSNLLNFAGNTNSNLLNFAGNTNSTRLNAAQSLVGMAGNTVGFSQGAADRQYQGQMNQYNANAQQWASIGSAVSSGGGAMGGAIAGVYQNQQMNARQDAYLDRAFPNTTASAV